MIQIICLYLLVGTIASLVIESAMSWATKGEVIFTMAERSVSIVLWPMTSLVFLYNFVKGMFN
jgi:uncharacterized membrane protein